MTACQAPRHAEPEPAAPHARLCRPCAAWLRRDLHRLPHLYASLGDLLDPRRASGPGTGDGGGLPYHEPAAECRSQIAHDLETWAKWIIDERQPDAWPARSIPAMAGWLSGWVHWGRGGVPFHSWAGDMAGAFLADARRAIAVLNPMPRAQFVIPRGMNWCPACHERGRLTAVVSQDETDRRPSMVWCGGCGKEWDFTQVTRLGRDILKQVEGKAA